MVRGVALLAVLGVLCGGRALAATEEDRRTCATEHNADLRIGACTRVIEDQGTAPTVRMMAYRDRGVAYSNKGLQELAIADLDEALKIDANDSAALAARGRANLARGQYDRAIATAKQQEPFTYGSLPAQSFYFNR